MKQGFGLYFGFSVLLFEQRSKAAMNGINKGTIKNEGTQRWLSEGGSGKG